MGGKGRKRSGNEVNTEKMCQEKSLQTLKVNNMKKHSRNLRKKQVKNDLIFMRSQIGEYGFAFALLLFTFPVVLVCCTY